MKGQMCSSRNIYMYTHAMKGHLKLVGVRDCKHQIMTKLGLEPLYYRRRTHILRFVDECIANRVPRYLSNFFNVRNRDIHRHKTRNKNDLILEGINLECTKRAFFYKGAKIFINF